jgi:uncharacterized protein (UPF0276 family)
LWGVRLRMITIPGRTAIGCGWRPELALAIDRDSEIDFVEVTAENTNPHALPAPVELLRKRGVPVTVHGLALSLGGTDPLDPHRIERLRLLTAKLEAPVVSEHVAFVRAGGLEAGHLLPVARTRTAMELLVENVKMVQDVLRRPLALENIATFLDWPEGELDEPAFFSELLERTGAWLLLDVSNLYANARNHGWDAITYLQRMPLHRLAYVHIGGGIDRDGLYYDTHAHPLPEGPLELLEELCARVMPPAVLLERDEEITGFDLEFELGRIRASVRGGEERRHRI